MSLRHHRHLNLGNFHHFNFAGGSEERGDSGNSVNFGLLLRPFENAQQDPQDDFRKRLATINIGGYLWGIRGTLHLENGAC